MYDHYVRKLKEHKKLTRSSQPRKESPRTGMGASSVKGRRQPRRASRRQPRRQPSPRASGDTQQSKDEELENHTDGRDPSQVERSKEDEEQVEPS